MEIIHKFYDETGHRSKQTIFEHVVRCYQWKDLYADVAKYVNSCEEYQCRIRNRYEESLHPI